MTGFPLAGRVKGPISHFWACCACKPTLENSNAASQSVRPAFMRTSIFVRDPMLIGQAGWDSYKSILY
jgi:hypothetical protein